MFERLFGVKCPVGPDRKAWIERGLAWLGGQFGAARMLARPVVLPTPAFFPDPYDGSAHAAAAVFGRVCRWMEVSPDRVTLSLFDGDRGGVPPHLREGRSAGAAGLYLDEGLGRMLIAIDRGQLADPTALVGTMAHELGHVHLLGDKRLSADSPDHEPLTDLLTVLYGLGIFTANSVIREANWSDGARSGWSVGRQGYLTGPEYGYAMALIAQARGEAKPAWAAHLRLDVRSALHQGLRFLAATRQPPFTRPAPAVEEDVPWTRPRPATAAADDDDLPPWARKRKR
ncbi:MAG: hypothetical protein ACRC33_17060 [Gemmataceae bacterium]